ncbi:hypothetical protein LR61_07720 [Morganella morganii]|nr:hypothetical protein LR61_07720 [Morganella morganii]
MILAVLNIGNLKRVKMQMIFGYVTALMARPICWAMNHKHGQKPLPIILIQHNGYLMRLYLQPANKFGIYGNRKTTIIAVLKKKVRTQTRLLSVT